MRLSPFPLSALPSPSGEGPGVRPVLRFVFVFVFVFIFVSNLFAQNVDKKEAKLQEYMDRFPQSQLRDVYKFCFQDRFGLEHLLSDSMAAVRYIEYEINNADTTDWHNPLFHYSLLNGNYVRVDINYVRQGIVPLGVMVSAMLQSSKGVEPVNEDQVAAWREEWGRLREALLHVRPVPLNFEEDSEMIDSLLASGKYAIHHSAHYNQTYHQHYRIVRKDVFESLILPLITQ